jgi:hypothetical protein
VFCYVAGVGHEPRLHDILVTLFDHPGSNRQFPRRGAHAVGLVTPMVRLLDRMGGENTFPISIRCDSVSNNKTIRIRTIIPVHAKEDLKN